MKLYTFVPNLPQCVAICASMENAIDYAENYRSTVFIKPIELNHKNDVLHYQLQNQVEFSGRVWRRLGNLGAIKELCNKTSHITVDDWFERIQPVLQMIEIIEK